jgi:hypothetical protein
MSKKKRDIMESLRSMVQDRPEEVEAFLKRAAPRTAKPVEVKQRFQIFLEAAQLKALRVIEQRTGTPVGRQIRMAVDRWLKAESKKAAPRRASTRRKA